MDAFHFSEPGFRAVADTISSEAFRKALALQTGYDTSHTGELNNF